MGYLTFFAAGGSGGEGLESCDAIVDDRKDFAETEENESESESEERMNGK